MNNKKDNIRLSSDDAINNYLASINEKKFRLKQIKEWLWKKRATSFHQMKNIPKSCINLLDDKYQISPISIHQKFISSDRTIKYIFKTHDNLLIEGVLIPSTNRVTACISSQVGCVLKCDFCATGQMKFQRNLTYDEIFDQVFLLKQESELHFFQPLSNIVFMGMGEPLLNYENVSKSINIITSENSLHISGSRITVSSVGIPKMIEALSKELPKIHLAISLHSAKSNIRKTIMPIEEKYSLLQLKKSIENYYHQTKNRITFEYLLLKNINDSVQDANALHEFAKYIPCKINIIKYNKTDNSSYDNSDKNTVNNFVKYLESKNMIVNIRESRGQDINAACGQLISKN